MEEDPMEPTTVISVIATAIVVALALGAGRPSSGRSR